MDPPGSQGISKPILISNDLKFSSEHKWFIVSKVKVTHGAASAAADAKNGYGDYLIEEEEGLNDHNFVVKCAEIQTAISEGHCIVGVWLHGSVLRPSSCPVCRRPITLLVPSQVASLLRDEPEIAPVMNRIEQYNGRFAGVPHNFRAKNFPLLVSTIKAHFSSSLPPGVDTVWFDYKGLPLKWCIPIGVLFDLLCADTERPWNLTVHLCLNGTLDQ
ncbi:hypothetical protein D1007_35230 [Hordeum vulgare]|nr:hypothetical protein D1007_35230 [Hordeum vulgare]